MGDLGSVRVIGGGSALLAAQNSVVTTGYTGRELVQLPVLFRGCCM